MMGMAPARCLCKLLDLTSGQNTLQGDRKSTQRSRNGLELRQVVGRHRGQASQTSNAGLTAPAARNTHCFTASKAEDSAARVSAPCTPWDWLNTRSALHHLWRNCLGMQLHLQTVQWLITRESSARLAHTRGGREHHPAEISSSWSSHAGFGAPTSLSQREAKRTGQIVPVTLACLAA